MKFSERSCWRCQRPFNGCGSQTQCRRRDCSRWGELPEDTPRRLREIELALLVEQQKADDQADRLGLARTPGKGKGAWANGSVYLDGYLVGTDVSLHEVLTAAPRYLVEWLEPVVDQVLEEVRLFEWALS